MNTTDQDFLTSVSEALNGISPELLSPVPLKDEQTKAQYVYIEEYLHQNHLYYASLALPQVCRMITQKALELDSRFHNADTHYAYFQHALAVCQMLIDLHIPVSSEEADVMLAAALFHILPENIHYNDLKSVLTKECGMSNEIYQIVNLIFREKDGSAAEQQEFYNHILQNKTALMIKLADRGNLVQQLYVIPSWSARSYITETRNYFFPMCIYAKEHYRDLLAPVSVLMEKIRCLIEVAEILLSRYEAKENDLSTEILRLQEENAVLRGMIQAIKETDLQHCC